MILYDTKDWGETFRMLVAGFTHSDNYKSLVVFTLCFSGYSAAIIGMEAADWFSVMRFNTVVFSLIGVILSMILVFRLNSSYNKWWEGRQQWGRLINVCRACAQHIAPIVQDDPVMTKRWAATIGNFPYALKIHLREESDLEEIKDMSAEELSDMGATHHIPNYVGLKMQQDLETLQKAGRITSMDKHSIAKLVHAMIDILGACERIKNTPIPFSHSSFIQLALIIYLSILPFGLIESFGWMTVFMQAVMTFALVGVEIISEEIEEPFGRDANDLPLSHLSNVIRKDTYAILSVDMPETHLSEAHELDNTIRLQH